MIQFCWTKSYTCTSYCERKPRGQRTLISTKGNNFTKLASCESSSWVTGSGWNGCACASGILAPACTHIQERAYIDSKVTGTSSGDGSPPQWVPIRTWLHSVKVITLDHIQCTLLNKLWNERYPISTKEKGWRFIDSKLLCRTYSRVMDNISLGLYNIYIYNIRLAGCRSRGKGTSPCKCLAHEKTSNPGVSRLKD